MNLRTQYILRPRIFLSGGEEAFLVLGLQRRDFLVMRERNSRAATGRRDAIADGGNVGEAARREARQFRRLHVLVALEGQLSEAEGVRYIPARGVVQEAEEAEQALIVLVTQVMGQDERGRRVLEAGEDALVSD